MLPVHSPQDVSPVAPGWYSISRYYEPACYEAETKAEPVKNFSPVTVAPSDECAIIKGWR